MQIIVPMSGFGERFRRAGYDVPKPLIVVDGKPIIAHVIDMFPGETDFLFICNQDHLDTPEYALAEQLAKYCPTGRIVGIPPHKLGPVNAVLQAVEHIDLDKPTIVNYCDFTCVWDYRDFVDFVVESGCDGAIPCYTGFHPHMLGSITYAYVRNEGVRITAIQEKQSYTDNPMGEFCSSGTYYYASAGMMLDAFRRCIGHADLSYNNEYFASLAYRPLMTDGRQILVYELNHFMQWGTPQDLEEYVYWSDMFRELCDPARAQSQVHQQGSVLIPMAGLGARFSREGYVEPKPLIPVSGRPMVVQATLDLPVAQHHTFVMRRDLPGHESIAATLRNDFPGSTLVEIDQVTDGQARTCLLGMDGIDPTQPLTIGACDNGALYDPQALTALLEDPDVDVIVWAARGYPGAIRRPPYYGWVEEKDGHVLSVTGKQALGDPANDPSLIGAFTFKRGGDFIAAANAMIVRDARVNGEFYVDICINDAIAAGLRARVFVITHYLCWGTPDDLRTFEYWQSCFHKWPSHPYRLENDSRVPPSVCSALEQRYAMRRPARLEA